MRRLAMAGLAGALLIGGPACSDDADDADDTAADDEATETTAASTSAAADEGSTTTSTEAEETTTTVEELTNDVIRASMEQDHPDEAALVDWSIFSWVSGFGYTATTPPGSTSDQAVAVCEALSEVIYGHGASDAIQVITIEAPDVPLASRQGAAGRCAPA